MAVAFPQPALPQQAEQRAPVPRCLQVARVAQPAISLDPVAAVPVALMASVRLAVSAVVQPAEPAPAVQAVGPVAAPLVLVALPASPMPARQAAITLPAQEAVQEAPPAAAMREPVVEAAVVALVEMELRPPGHPVLDQRKTARLTPRRGVLLQMALEVEAAGERHPHQQP